MVEIIEKLKVEVHETAAQKRDWKPAYRPLMQEVRSSRSVRRQLNSRIQVTADSAGTWQKQR